MDGCDSVQESAYQSEIVDLVHKVDDLVRLVKELLKNPDSISLTKSLTEGSSLRDFTTKKIKETEEFLNKYYAEERSQ